MRDYLSRWMSLSSMTEFGAKEIEFYKSIGVIIKAPNIVLTKEQGQAIIDRVQKENKMKQEKYKVVIREKLTHTVIESSDTITGYDSWITACRERDFMWEDFTKDKADYYIEINEVK